MRNVCLWGGKAQDAESRFTEIMGIEEGGFRSSFSCNIHVARHENPQTIGFTRFQKTNFIDECNSFPQQLM